MGMELRFQSVYAESVQGEVEEKLPKQVEEAARQLESRAEEELLYFPYAS